MEFDFDLLEKRFKSYFKKLTRWAQLDLLIELMEIAGIDEVRRETIGNRVRGSSDPTAQ